MQLGAEMRKCRNAETRKRGNAEMWKCRNAEMRECGNAGTGECGNAGIRECGNAETRACQDGLALEADPLTRPGPMKLPEEDGLLGCAKDTWALMTRATLPIYYQDEEEQSWQNLNQAALALKGRTVMFIRSLKFQTLDPARGSRKYL